MIIDNNNISTENNQQLTPEENQALLGWQTNLMESMMPQEMSEEGMGGDMPMEGQETPESAPGEEKKMKTDKDRMAEMDGKFEQFKEDINKTIDDKLSQITTLIEKALKEDDGQENEN